MLKLWLLQGKKALRKPTKNVVILFQHLSLSTSKTHGICARKIENYCVRTGKDKLGIEYYKIWFGIILPKRVFLNLGTKWYQKWYLLKEFRPRTRNKIRVWFLWFWNRGKCQKRIHCRSCWLRRGFKLKIIRWRSLRPMFRLRHIVWRIS